jgi:hypothetical protein
MSEYTKKAEKKLDELSDRNVDSTGAFFSMYFYRLTIADPKYPESEARYLAYTSRLMTAVRASSRYVAYVGKFHAIPQLDSHLLDI